MVIRSSGFGFIDPGLTTHLPTAEPVVLEGQHVRLEPLSLDHLDALCDVGLDPGLWEWIPNPVSTREDLEAYVRAALKGQGRGTMLSFATVERASGRVVGSTRYGNIDLKNRRLEIGWTWVARPWQRTAINTEAKLLMLGHAFGPLRCLRVEFKTDALNEHSRRAILRLGAKEEGILRKHMTTETDRVRDTVYFSIIDDEWPSVERRLQEMLKRLLKYYAVSEAHEFWPR
ncbi:MAG: GNAT family N-acetyltransferase [Bacteroidetes bacterium]|nr:GNAT family N-acetyltransferase [Bacteroidota bacterium]